MVHKIKATGRWQGRYRDESGKQHAKNFTRKSDATAWEAEQQTAVGQGTWRDPAAGQVTLSEFYTEWAARKGWTSTTRTAMDLAVRDCSFREVPLRQIRRSHVEAWVAMMSQRRLAPSTIKTRRDNVRSVLRAAVADRRISSDPTEGAPLPRARRQEAALRVPTPEQVARILTASNPHGAVLIQLAAFAGLRVGECCGLRVGDVDPLHKLIRVKQQVQRAPGGEVEVRLPKYGSERDMYAPQELMEELAAYIAEHRPGTDRERWLVIGSDGVRPWHQNSAGHAWRSACARAGVSGVRFHDLRHFFASGLIHQGCDVVTVARALGHQATAETLKTYAHLWRDGGERTRVAASGLVGQVSAAQVGQDEDSLRTVGGLTAP